MSLKNLKIDESDHQLAKILAAKKGISIKELIENLIKEAYAKEEKRRKK